MHSCIEKRCRNEKIHTKSQWCGLIKEAAVRKPYEVKVFEQNDFIDFHELADNQKWEKVRISEVQEIHFDPSTKQVSVKYEASEPRAAVDISKEVNKTKVD